MRSPVPKSCTPQQRDGPVRIAGPGRASTQPLQDPVELIKAAIGDNDLAGAFRALGDGNPRSKPLRQPYLEPADIGIDGRRTGIACSARAPHQRFGLAHCDLRLGNLLLVGDDTRVIDFDDCGLSWFLYDLASALTLIDNRPNTGGLVDAWLGGYRSRRSLEREDLMAMSTLVMLRRFAILAWFGSHAETELARENSEGFAAEMCTMGEAYLSREPDPETPLPWL